MYIIGTIAAVIVLAMFFASLATIIVLPFVIMIGDNILEGRIATNKKIHIRREEAAARRYYEELAEETAEEG